MAVWQMAASLVAEVAIHIPISVVLSFSRVCRVVTMFVKELPMAGLSVL